MFETALRRDRTAARGVRTNARDPPRRSPEDDPVIAACAALRGPLHAGALLAIVGASPPALRGTPGTLHGQPCAPASCALATPTPAERDALLAEADRLLTRYADDDSPLGRQCHALGDSMRVHAADVRMIAYMWREIDEEGDLAPVTGDAHRVEPVPGSGLVHIARGFDALNPDRGLPAILQTARHEFAHLNGAPQSQVWRIDVAAQLAVACGPS
jgi:hypothetical protein